MYYTGHEGKPDHLIYQAASRIFPSDDHEWPYQKIYDEAAKRNYSKSIRKLRYFKRMGNRAKVKHLQRFISLSKPQDCKILFA